MENRYGQLLGEEKKRGPTVGSVKRKKGVGCEGESIFRDLELLFRKSVSYCQLPLGHNRV